MTARHTIVATESEKLHYQLLSAQTVEQLDEAKRQIRKFADLETRRELIEAAAQRQIQLEQ
jgi:hypothetical protein